MMGSYFSSSLTILLCHSFYSVLDCCIVLLLIALFSSVYIVYSYLSLWGCMLSLFGQTWLVTKGVPFFFIYFELTPITIFIYYKDLFRVKFTSFMHVREIVKLFVLKHFFYLCSVNTIQYTINEAFMFCLFFSCKFSHVITLIFISCQVWFLIFYIMLDLYHTSKE